MFDKDFFPTLRSTFQDMVRGYDLRDKIILEPEGVKNSKNDKARKRKSGKKRKDSKIAA